MRGALQTFSAPHVSERTHEYEHQNGAGDGAVARRLEAEMDTHRTALMSSLMTTGCWEGAMIPEQGGEPTHFALRQPPRDGAMRPAMTLALADAAPEPVNLLEGAARTLVGLVESTQLLIEARIRSGRLVGRWLRRDARGTVVASGALIASRAQG